MGVIEAKVGGEQPKPAAKAEPTKIGDLMAALEASVAAAREGRRAGGDEKAPAKAASRAAPTKAAPSKAASSKRRSTKADEVEKPARRRKTA
jgi:DNA end-binding protein Ku